MLKKIITPFVPKFILRKWEKIKEEQRFLKWQNGGQPSPTPHLAKQQVIAEYQQKYDYRLFVETGTYLGKMVEAQRKRFEKIISIELGSELCAKAQKRFEKYKHITIVQGDSGKVLPYILKNIEQPAIFWLDGHYSGTTTAKGDTNCPIFNELNAIFSSKKFNHILLIDDARFFNGTADYPTIQQLSDFILSKNNNYRIDVKHDIIRCVVQ